VRTIIDLPEDQLAALDLICRREQITIRRTRRIRLPDAIVWASARTESALLVTRNTKDFPEADPGVRVPYTI
jgi:predicted nucleic acid-binding protein